VIARYVAGVCLTLALLGCQSPGSGFGAPAEVQRASDPFSRSAGREKVLLNFDGTNGLNPTSGVTQLQARSDAFYGTTMTGGSDGVGTVYRVTATGSGRVVRNVKGGFSPTGALTPLGDEFYGTAGANDRCRSRGAAKCAGEVYAIDKVGKRRLVYAFKGGRDGAQPRGTLTALNGTLYGVTSYGGKYGVGTIFSVTPDGREKVLHSFVKPYGVQPTGGLVALNGVLYGTTASGGANSDGTVFSVTTGGQQTVIYSFAGSPDGASPQAGLTEVDGTLYGTTAGGGSEGCNLGGACGIVFSIDTSGHETVLHSFAGADGDTPVAALIDVGGTLYGTTTIGGGVYACGDIVSCGTVFSIDTSGNERVIHTFTGAPDGAFPHAELVYSNGALVGTTQGGGSGESGGCVNYHGCGTVFAVPLPTHRSAKGR
jgi:uncharacterized repeat protein (TIGR03803 family)